jgi:hypothetical protein
MPTPAVMSWFPKVSFRSGPVIYLHARNDVACVLESVNGRIEHETASIIGPQMHFASREWLRGVYAVRSIPPPQVPEG